MASLLDARNLTLILAAGMGVLAIYSRTATPKSFNDGRMKIFTDMLGALSVLVFGLTLIGQQSENEHSQYIEELNYTDQDIREQWIEPNAMFADKATIAPELVASLNQQNTMLQAACAKSASACQKAAIEQNICFDIAQRVENFLTFRNSDTTGDNTWLSCFLPWHRSPILQKFYPVIKYAYRDRTQALMELMFEYANSQPLNTSDDIDKVANMIIADKRYKHLLTITKGV